MNIVSHNSLTYLKPKKWWMRLLGFTARCQRITLEEQYKLGVRFFDVRILPNVIKNTIEVRHGLIEYDCNINEVFEWMNTKSVIMCRVILEQNRTNKKYQDKIDKDFYNFCSKLEDKYKNISFVGGERKYDRKQLFKFANDYPENVDYKYSSADNSSILDDLYPYSYAKKYNKENIRKAFLSDKDYIWVDFVDMVCEYAQTLIYVRKDNEEIEEGDL